MPSFVAPPSAGFLLPWSPLQDVRHQISINPADDACIHISDLKQVVDTGITGSSAAVDHLPHPLILRSPLILENLHVNYAHHLMDRIWPCWNRRH